LGKAYTYLRHATMKFEPKTISWSRRLKQWCLGFGILFACIWALDVVRFDEILCPRTTLSRLVRSRAPVDFEQYGAMLERIKGVQRACGALCNSSLKGSPSKYFDNIRAPVNCDAIFVDSRIDAPREQPLAPEDLPTEFIADFTLNGRFPFRRYPCAFYDTVYLTKNAHASHWSEELLNELKQKAENGTLEGTYGVGATNSLMEALKKVGMKGKRCLVIGSERPWVEAALLASGAQSIVTLEYGKIESTHPQVTTMLPSHFARTYLDGTLGTFDAVVTFSSVEHAGLGRYGDALLPWGDILAVARGWCVTKSGGDLVIAVPYGTDELMFNAHRRYGPVRYPFLVANWKQVNMVPANQPIYVLSKQDPVAT